MEGVQDQIRRGKRSSEGDKVGVAWKLYDSKGR
jgi:hypothetical protein